MKPAEYWPPHGEEPEKDKLLAWHEILIGCTMLGAMFLGICLLISYSVK